MPLEECKNCGGTAIATYRYGKPGQNRHLPASQTEWEDKTTHRVCRPCKGTGQRWVKPGRTGTIYLFPSGDVDWERTVNKNHQDEQRILPPLTAAVLAWETT